MIQVPSSRGRLLAALCVFVIGLTAVAWAQDRPQASSGPSAGPLTAAERRVRDAVLGRFRPLPVQNGIVLVPLGRIEGVDNVELRDGVIAINGRAATGGEVRDRLRRDADAVLELSYLDLAAQQRTLLGPARDTASGETSPPRREPAAPPGAPLPPEPPVPPSAPDREFRRDVQGRVRLGGNVTVTADEEINGPVVAIGGSVHIDGRVRDDVVAVFGDVHLGRRAEVYGDVTAVGGTFEREPGARVRGRVNEVDFSIPAIHVRPLSDWTIRLAPWLGGPWRAVRLFGTLLRVAFVALLATLFVLLVPRAVERVDTAVRTQPWKSALVGLFAQLLFIPLLVTTVVLLAVSVIGIPLLALVPFGVLAFVVAFVLGFAGAASGLARTLQQRFGWSALSPFVLVFVGLALIWGVTVVGRVVGLGGGPLAVTGAMLVFVGFLLEYVAWTLGLGGALITRFGRRGELPGVVPPAPSVPLDPLPSDPSWTVGSELPPDDRAARRE